MFNKRGQITIFVIVSILILAIIGLYYFTSKEGINQDAITPEIAPIYESVYECIEESIPESIIEIGQNGGYRVPTNFSTSSGFAYYYFNNTNYMPSKNQIMEELSLSIIGKIFACTNDFKEFTEVNIFQRDPEVEVIMGDNKILFEIKYPLTIEKENSTSLLEDFGEFEYNLRLGLMYNSVYEIIEESNENICFSCIGEKAIENDFYVEVRDYDEESIIFTFKDENSIINGNPFIFKFANKYTLKENEE
jgi:hypothetical protein